MSFAVAAAGTGGHVYPGLAVGEALIDLGVDRSDILYIGGNRLEATVYPESGFPFLGVELRGLARRFTSANLGIPRVVLRAVRAIRSELAARRVGALLGMGGYVTVPAGLAALREKVPIAVAEQNAEAGLANRVVSRFASRAFVSFPDTPGLPGGEWVGNPIRRPLAEFDRHRLRPAALARFGLDDGVPVVGVFGGSLGAGAINRAVAAAVESWSGPPIQVLQLAGQGYEEAKEAARVSPVRWVVLDFCQEMDAFFAACDLVVARAGGSVAELTATATPAILVPGGFGSGGHQAANAARLEAVGAAEVVQEPELDRLGEVVARLAGDPELRRQMAQAATSIARPNAAHDIARALLELHP